MPRSLGPLPLLPIWQVSQKNICLTTVNEKIGKLRFAKMTSIKKISQFQDEFRFLSNFYPSPIVHEGISYPTVEHFYQGQKVLDPKARKFFSLLKTPGDAKKEGRRCTLRQDWESVKDEAMWVGLKLKFAPGSVLAEMLIATENLILEEGNYWGDVYWGIDLKRKTGKNKLGKMLMRLRQELAVIGQQTNT